MQLLKAESYDSLKSVLNQGSKNPSANGKVSPYIVKKSMQNEWSDFMNKNERKLSA